MAYRENIEEKQKEKPKKNLEIPTKCKRVIFKIFF